MRLKRTAILALPFALLFAADLRADTVILKSGEKLEGNILNETDAELTIRVQVTATIKDERVVKKSDIDKVLKIQPDLEAWTPLAPLVIAADSLDREDYTRIVAALEFFLRKFPDSTMAPKAKEKLEQFSAEQKRVDQGEMKIDNRWLTQEQVLEERVQIGGRILLNRMKRAVTAGQLTEAMGYFDQLEKAFGGSSSYPDAIELANQLLPSLKIAVNQRQAQVKKVADDEKQRLANAKGTEKDQLTALLKDQRTRTEAAVAAYEKAGHKWLPLQPATDKSLSSLNTKVTSEMTKLRALPVEKMRESIRVSEAAATAFANGDLDGATKSVNEAAATWPANDLAKRLRVKIADAKKAATEAKSGAGKPAPAPAPAPAPKSKSSPNASVPAPSIIQPDVPAAPRSETPMFTKPGFFVAVAAVVAFGTIGAKVLAKYRSPESNAFDR